MASEYFLEPEINLVTENTENILSEGEVGGVGNKGPGSQGRSWEKGQDQERGEVEGKECRLERRQSGCTWLA